MSEAKRKPSWEQALDALRSSATTVFNCYPEAETITVAVGWAGHVRDVPAGFILSHDNRLTAAQLLHSAEQQLRMATFTIAQLQKALAQLRQQNEEVNYGHPQVPPPQAPEGPAG
jgi:hypothetical protein